VRRGAGRHRTAASNAAPAEDAQQRGAQGGGLRRLGAQLRRRGGGWGRGEAGGRRGRPAGGGVQVQEPGGRAEAARQAQPQHPRAQGRGAEHHQGAVLYLTGQSLTATPP
jgi:hypothetical protein